MNDLSKNITEEDRILLSEIVNLFNNRNYQVAIQKIKDRLGSLDNCKSKSDYYLKIELAGYLIDIGEEGQIKEAAIEGLQIIEKEKDNINGIISSGSIEYNLGNAKSTIFNINRGEPNFRYSPMSIDYLIESKNHFWKSYKVDLDAKKTFTPQLIVNLANTLSNCGRITESLQYYDVVIEKYPEFPQAHASRSNELLWLKELTGGFTQNLIYQAMNGFEIASKSNEVSPWLKELWKNKSVHLKEYLSELNTGKDIHREAEETQKEYNSLSEYRKFTLKNHLSLSEHSLYCNCIGARQDDLIICIPFQSLGADIIPLMEKTLNRLKSEYSLARLFYYNAVQKKNNDLTQYDSEVKFTELYDSEYIGTCSEMLRTSFRLCFGILDKIASAICHLFDLADEKENIYFESFWNPKNKKGSYKQNTRWEKINKIDNISLIALYTQATDLNSQDGEWNFFKSWRNALEHNQMSLLITKEIGGDIFHIYRDNPSLIITDKEYFKEKTLQFLQFTRSAIFNFVFLVRNEARKLVSEDALAIPITLTFKNEI